MATQLLSKIELNRDWTAVNLSDCNQFYLIAIKQSKASGDTIDPADVKKICFECAIDSGVTNKYLTIDFVTLDFTETTSTDEAFNKISAFKRLLNVPADFYIRPIQIETNDGKVITTGQSTIKINVNPVILGAN